MSRKNAVMQLSDKTIKSRRRRAASINDVAKKVILLSEDDFHILQPVKLCEIERAQSTGKTFCLIRFLHPSLFRCQNEEDYCFAAA
jgi:hypothetical protein